MYSRASRGEPADEGGLLADGADRRFAKIVDLSGQEACHPAGKEQSQIARRRVGVWAGQAIRRDMDERRSRVAPAQSIGVMSARLETLRPPLADDEIGRREAARDRIALCELLAVVQIFGKWRRAVPLGAGNVGTDIREQSTTDGGGRSTAKLDDPEPRQQIQWRNFPVGRMRYRARYRAVNLEKPPSF